MRNIIVIFIVFFLAGCYGNKSEVDISGKWQWEANDSDTDFSIELFQDGNNVTGSYCGIYNSGTRIDCPFDDDINITGEYTDGKWKLYYTSNFSMNKGKAIIKYNVADKTLTWKDLTTDNGSLCPENAVLVR